MYLILEFDAQADRPATVLRSLRGWRWTRRGLERRLRRMRGRSRYIVVNLRRSGGVHFVDGGALLPLAFPGEGLQPDVRPLGPEGPRPPCPER